MELLAIGTGVDSSAAAGSAGAGAFVVDFAFLVRGVRGFCPAAATMWEPTKR